MGGCSSLYSIWDNISYGLCKYVFAFRNIIAIYGWIVAYRYFYIL
ncbi:hypothetical protein J503_3992 [Acinetobacter baumannii 984213]|nr:hypothetical protein J503_3992 [Acinetobacter baumannii 984213]EXB20603.1 hypothetical protein J535_1355 [Acinetobacter baumannii 1429530]